MIYSEDKTSAAPTDGTSSGDKTNSGGRTDRALLSRPSSAGKLASLGTIVHLGKPPGAGAASPFSEEELKTLGSGDDEDIPAAKRAAMASAMALRAAAGGSPLAPPKSAAEVDFDIVDPPDEPVVPPGRRAVLGSLTLVSEHDVLCGRGGGTNSQMGNRRYRALVRDFQPTYLMARRRDKPRMARSVVLIVRRRGGRFLRRDDADGRLYEVGDEKAEAKTSQALREGLDVRATKTAANTLINGAEAGGDRRGGTKKKPRHRSPSPENAPAKPRAMVEAIKLEVAESPQGGAPLRRERSLPGVTSPIHTPARYGSGGPARPTPPTSRAHTAPVTSTGYYSPPYSTPQAHPPRYDDPYYRAMGYTPQPGTPAGYDYGAAGGRPGALPRYPSEGGGYPSYPTAYPSYPSSAAVYLSPARSSRQAPGTFPTEALGGGTFSPLRQSTGEPPIVSRPQAL